MLGSGVMAAPGRCRIFLYCLTQNTGPSSNRMHITTNHGELTASISDLGLEDMILDAGGLERKIRVFRLPDTPLDREMTLKRNVRVPPQEDNPIWICVTTEDGYQASSSPIYLIS